jgi:hypothetical protein
MAKPQESLLRDEIKSILKKAGRKLKPAEIELVNALTEAEEPAEGTGRAWVTSVAKLSDELGVDRKTIHNRLHKFGHKADPSKGYPGRTVDGRYSIKDWRDFLFPSGMSAGRAGGSPPPEPAAATPLPGVFPGAAYGEDLSTPSSKQDWEIEKIKEVVRGLKFQQAIREGRYSLNDDVIRWCSDTMMQVRTILLGIPPKLAPEIEMRTRHEAEELLKNCIDEALQIIHERDWGETHPTPAVE